MQGRNITEIQWQGKRREELEGKSDEDEKNNKNKKHNRKNGRKNEGKELGVQGMMTVEASVIVSIILIIIAVYLFFSLFVMDMSVAKSETLRLADEAAAVWKTEGNLSDGEYNPYQLIKRNKSFLWQKSRASLASKAKARLQKRTSARLMVSSLKGCKINILGDRVRVQMSLIYKSPILGSRKYAGIAGWTFQSNVKADIGNEEEVVRRTAAKIINNREVK